MSISRHRQMRMTDLRAGKDRKSSREPPPGSSKPTRLPQLTDNQERTASRAHEPDPRKHSTSRASTAARVHRTPGPWREERAPSIGQESRREVN